MATRSDLGNPARMAGLDDEYETDSSPTKLAGML